MTEKHKKKNIDNTVFLATTALEEFWDKTLPIVFLGEWCRRYSRRLVWESLDAEVLEYPWINGERFFNAFNYIEELYECAIDKLSRNLNRIHGITFSDRYWRILIGPWLRWYISIMYDRYTCLQDAIDRYPDFTTIVISPDSYVTPLDTLEFIQLAKDDGYNLQIFSRILVFLGKSFPDIGYDITYLPFGQKPKRKDVRSLISQLAVGATNFVWKLRGENRCIVLKSSYFPFLIQARFAVRTLGKVLNIIDNVDELRHIPKDESKRVMLKGITSNKKLFENMIDEMIPFDIPKVYVELFQAIREEGKRKFPRMPKAIISADGWYYDEYFKQWAAFSGEQGSMLIGVQHGGNYGSLEYIASDHEVVITDRFYSWGWKHKKYPDKVIPFPAPKLCCRKQIGADNKKHGILFATTSIPRYLFQFPFLPNMFCDYLSWQERFVIEVSRRRKGILRIRSHREDFGWDIDFRRSAKNIDVLIEGWDVPFKESLKSCRIFVGDSITTTFIESLSARKPTILFWDSKINVLKSDAQPFYEKLREAGILFDSPEDAATAVDLVYDDVETWWNEPFRQEIINDFCRNFARTEKNFYILWLNEFERILEFSKKSKINK